MKNFVRSALLFTTIFAILIFPLRTYSSNISIIPDTVVKTLNLVGVNVGLIGPAVASEWTFKFGATSDDYAAYPEICDDAGTTFSWFGTSIDFSAILSNEGVDTACNGDTITLNHLKFLTGELGSSSPHLNTPVAADVTATAFQSGSDLLFKFVNDVAGAGPNVAFSNGITAMVAGPLDSSPSDTSETQTVIGQDAGFQTQIAFTNNIKWTADGGGRYWGGR